MESQTNNLMQRLADGDEEAKHILFAQFKQPIESYVSRRIDAKMSARFDAADVLQEAFIVANRRLKCLVPDSRYPEHPCFKTSQSFHAWLRLIAIDCLLKQRQKNFAEKRTIERECRAEDPESNQPISRVSIDETTPAQQCLQKERRALVRAAVRRLKSTDRRIIELKYLDHLSSPEIAEALSLSEAAVRMRHLRAIEKLNLLLQRD